MYIPTNWLRNIGEIFILAYSLLILLAILCLMAYVFAPLSPLVTTLFVIGGTVLAFERKTTATLAIAGIVIYLASWFMFPRFGEMISTPVCGIGIMIWFWAVTLTLPSIINPKPVPTT